MEGDAARRKGLTSITGGRDDILAKAAAIEAGWSYASPG
jgi:hypothetical protein